MVLDAAVAAGLNVPPTYGVGLHPVMFEAFGWSRVLVLHVELALTDLVNECLAILDDED